MKSLGQPKNDGPPADDAAPREAAPAAAPALRRIVAALDLSAPSRAAAELAASLAARHDARLYVIHAAPIVLGDAPENGNGSQPIDALFDAVEQRLREEAARTGTPRDPWKPVVECVRAGAPAEQVVAFARERGADLVVMGTHARSGIERLLLGSVAEEVVARTPCPVLIAREGVVAAPVRRALVGVDYSESSGAALAVAARLAARDDGSVDALRVIDAHLASGNAALSTRDGDDVRESLLGIARQNLDRWIDGLGLQADKRARIHAVVRIGCANTLLAELAAEGGYDLVACGTRGGRGALGRALLGSVAQAVVRSARVPVLVAKGPAMA